MTFLLYYSTNRRGPSCHSTNKYFIFYQMKAYLFSFSKLERRFYPTGCLVITSISSYRSVSITHVINTTLLCVSQSTLSSRHRANHLIVFIPQPISASLLFFSQSPSASLTVSQNISPIRSLDAEIPVVRRLLGLRLR